MNRVIYIEPGTETMAQWLDAMRALALTAAAQEAEFEACVDGRLTVRSSDYGEDHDREDTYVALDRADDARQALALEVEDAERAGVLAELSAALAVETAGRP